MNEQELRAMMLAAILAQGLPLAQAVTDAEAAVRYVLGTPNPERPMTAAERRNKILDMWADGYTALRIAEQLGMTESGVRAALYAARKKGDARAVHKAILSPEERERRIAHGRRHGGLTKRGPSEGKAT